MLDIKKYSNGKYFDAVNQKYLKKDRIKEYIKKGEQLKITLTTTGEDITDDILSQFEKSTRPMGFGGFITSDLKRWIFDTIDHRVKRVLDVMNLPTKDQMAQLNADLKSLDTKIQALEVKWQNRAANAPSDCENKGCQEVKTAFQYVNGHRDEASQEGSDINLDKPPSPTGVEGIEPSPPDSETMTLDDHETSAALTVSEAKKKEAAEHSQNDGANASDTIGDSKDSDSGSLSKITFDELLSGDAKTDDDKTNSEQNLSADGAGAAATDDAVKSATEPQNSPKKTPVKKAAAKKPQQKSSTAKKRVVAAKKRTPTKRS